MIDFDLFLFQSPNDSARNRRRMRIPQVTSQLVHPQRTQCIRWIMEVTSLTYIVQSGDTFDSIADKYGISPERLMGFNPGVNPYDLYIGQRIVVPPVFRYPPARERPQQPPRPMPPGIPPQMMQPHR
jgi:FOG: LysM repeat